MRGIWMAALGLLVAGCAGQGAQSVPQPARAQVQEGLGLPPTRAETHVDLRSVIAEGGRLIEVAGAICELQGPAFTGRFRTPARVVVPDLGRNAPVLAFACSDGTRSGTASVRASLRGARGLGGWPAVGLSVGTGSRRDVGVSVGAVFGGGALGASRAVYPVARVELR